MKIIITENRLNSAVLKWLEETYNVRERTPKRHYNISNFLSL